MNKRHSKLGLLTLEPRDVPSAVMFSEEWKDPENITLSFATDKTLIDGVQSDLAKVMPKGNDKQHWQRELLRAVQAYVEVTNLNVGVVTDTGLPFGTPGQIQGDTRFGDIRIGARPISTEALATAIPFNWSVDTWSGDVIFNSQTKYEIAPSATSTRPDLFTVALHEFGHVFGLPHSLDPDSVMSETYVGRRTGLAPSDIANVQDKFGGPRLPDIHEGLSGNGTYNTATTINVSNIGSLLANLGGNDPVDLYRFQVPRGSDEFIVNLHTAGLSLLTAKVDIVDSNGRVIESAISTTPLKGNLSLEVEDLRSGRDYFIRVTPNNSTGFGTGRYELSFVFDDDDDNNSSNEVADELFINDHGRNNTPASALQLQNEKILSQRNSDRLEYNYNGVIESRTDKDYYQFLSPANFSEGNQTLMIELKVGSSKQAMPRIELYDAQMNLVSMFVVKRNGPKITLQVNDISHYSIMYIRVSGDGTDASRGNYRLSMNFTKAREENLGSLQIGNLTDSSSVQEGELSVDSPGLFQFSLNSKTLSTTDSAELRLQIFSSDGKEIFDRDHDSESDPEKFELYLIPGVYTFRFSLVAKKNTEVNLMYSLSGGLFSDPMGPVGTTIGSTPIPSSPPPVSDPTPTSPPPPSSYTYQATLIPALSVITYPYLF